MRGLMRAKDVVVDDALDRIYKAWLANKIDSMRESDKRLLERMQRIDTIVREKNPQTIQKYSDKGMPYEVEYRRPWRKRELVDWVVAEFGVTSRQAYMDIDHTDRFFHSFETPKEKDFARGMQIEWGEEMMARAEVSGDYRAAAAFFKELNQIRGLRTHTPDAVDPRELIPTEPILIDDPSKLGFPALDEPVEQVKERLMKQLKSGFIDAFLGDAEDIDPEVEEEEI